MVGTASATVPSDDYPEPVSKSVTGPVDLRIAGPLHAQYSQTTVAASAADDRPHDDPDRREELPRRARPDQPARRRLLGQGRGRRQRRGGGDGRRRGPGPVAPTMSAPGETEGTIAELLDRALDAANRGDLVTVHRLAGEVLAEDATNADAEELLASEFPSAGELRRATIMFCDLVGSTELSGRHEPELYRGLVRRYKERCRQIIEDRYDGHIAARNRRRAARALRDPPRARQRRRARGARRSRHRRRGPRPVEDDRARRRRAARRPHRGPSRHPLSRHRGGRRVRARGQRRVPARDARRARDRRRLRGGARR